MFPAQHLSISIRRSPSDVYRFTSNPMNLPKWAEGLSSPSITQVNGEWICASPMGKLKVKFAPVNEFGIMDHDVTLPSGEKNHNPFRVVENHQGSEVIFALYRMPKMTDDEFQRDAMQILKDLDKLKTILES